jgi:hypothetical protein
MKFHRKGRQHGKTWEKAWQVPEREREVNRWWNVAIVNSDLIHILHEIPATESRNDGCSGDEKEREYGPGHQSVSELDFQKLRWEKMRHVSFYFTCSSWILTRKRELTAVANASASWGSHLPPGSAVYGATSNGMERRSRSVSKFGSYVSKTMKTNSRRRHKDHRFTRLRGW